MAGRIPKNLVGSVRDTQTANVAPVKAAPGEAPYVYDFQDDGVEAGGLVEYWHILRSHLGFLVLCGVMGALPVLLYTIPQAPVYRASATLEIQVRNPNFLRMYQVSMYDESSLFWDNKDIQTQIEIMQSEAILSRVFARLARPAEGHIATNGHISAWRQALNLPEPVEVDPHAAALDLAASSLNVKTRGDTRIVDISAESTSEAVAADFVNTLAEEYMQQNIESRWEMFQRTGEWLQRQLEEMRINLERSEDELQKYAAKAGLLYVAEQINVAEEKLRQIQQAMSEARADRIAKQSRYDLVKTSPAEALPDVVNDASLRGYQTKLTDLRRQEAELNTTFTPQHVSVLRVRAQLEALEGAIERERQAILQRIKNEFEEAAHREALLDLDFRNQTKLVTDQSARSIQYGILKREVDSNRELYDTILEQVKSASVASALRASNVRLVDPALPPETPISKNLTRAGLVGLTLGGFFGVVFVIARDRMDRSLKQPGDLSGCSNLPELGAIPKVKWRGGVRIVYRPKKKPPAAAKPKALARADVVLPRCIGSITARGNSSLIAESFRATVTSILCCADGGERPTVLTITSPYPGEGKTIVTSNLAIALAEVNQKVLLIDADLRRPRMHEIFAVENTNGLTDMLLDDGTVAEASMRRFIRQTVVKNLSLLPGGDPVAVSAKLLYSSTMVSLLEMAEKEFDMVLIDTPPMMHMPDARVVGRMSHAVILVARAERTNRETALVASQRFAEDGIRVLGSILNCWDPEGAPGRYGPYERYYKYYASRA
ncbi:MAG: polysaccharide biosynthesis tyrosine autokinase [bacterium]|nr:polysaccharide biosynthesis tyrosine autokinase [bacterium]